VLLLPLVLLPTWLLTRAATCVCKAMSSVCVWCVEQ
jgi:hypothetical protein